MSFKSSEESPAPPYKSVLIDHPVVGPLIPVYISRLKKFVREMRRHLAAAETEPIREMAHQLRGTGQSYGFNPITQYAAAIEEAIISNRGLSGIYSAVQELITYIENIEGYAIFGEAGN